MTILPSASLAGRDTLSRDTAFDDCGSIRCFNILGAFLQDGGAAPGTGAMRRDYLNDGITGEREFLFVPGAEIAPDFAGSSAARGLFDDPHHVNPGFPEVATVLAWNDRDGDGLINLNDDVYAGNPDGTVAYAEAYVIAEEEMEVFLGV